MASQITHRQANVANWVSIALAIVILIVRFVSGQYYLKSNFDVTGAVVLVSIAILVVRIVLSHLVLACGTASDILLEGAINIDNLNLEEIKAGSIMSLIARLLITTIYWLQCILLLLFYTRILSHIHWVRVGIGMAWFTICASYVAVIFSTFLECRPFRLYWQVQPDPGHCVRAYVQLFVQGVSNIIIDLFLLGISFPILNTQGRAWSQKCQIGFLYILGSFSIIITCIRIAYIHDSNSAQSSRSFWASIQAITSTFVANAPSIYGKLKLQRRKKTQSSSRRRADRPDTYVLMETQRDSHRQANGAEEFHDQGACSSDSPEQIKGIENQSWISEMEVTLSTPVQRTNLH